MHFTYSTPLQPISAVNKGTALLASGVQSLYGLHRRLN